MRTQTESALIAAGYVRSPNKIWEDVAWTPEGNSPLWYAGCVGIPEPGHNGTNNDVQVMPDDTLRVFRPDGLKTVTVATFQTVAAFLQWCRVNGQVSKPGLPAFSNAWD